MEATSEVNLSNASLDTSVNQPKIGEIRNNIPTLISIEETVKDVSLEFRDRQDLGLAQLESFVREHVRVVRIGDVDITIIDQEHNDYKGELDPTLEAFIKSKRTKTVVVEYFLPELRQNAASMGDTGIKRIEQSAASSGRGKMFMHIASEAKDVGKTVSTVDIANKASYEAYWGAIRMGVLPIIVSGFLPMNVQDHAITAFVSSLMSFSIDISMEGERKGIYNKQQISELENLYISMEDARRVFAAKALNQMGIDYNNEYPESNDDGRSQIVVVYPRAHALRIANNMTNQSLFTKYMNAAKSLFYRVPGLDYSYRTYSWSELASWQLTTSKKVKILS